MAENKGNPFHDEEGKFTTGPNQGGGSPTESEQIKLEDFEVFANGKKCGRFLAASEEEAVQKAKIKFPERFGEGAKIETREMHWQDNSYKSKLKEQLGVTDDTAEFPTSIGEDRDVSKEEVIRFLEDSLNRSLSDNEKNEMLKNDAIPVQLLEEIRIYSDDELENELREYLSVEE